MKIFIRDNDKNEWLKTHRGVCFEQVVILMERGIVQHSFRLPNNTLLLWSLNDNFHDADGRALYGTREYFTCVIILIGKNFCSADISFYAGLVLKLYDSGIVAALHGSPADTTLEFANALFVRANRSRNSSSFPSLILEKLEITTNMMICNFCERTYPTS